MEAKTEDDDKAKREELLEERMRSIREKNEKLMKRRQEIEDDRKNADFYSEMALKNSLSLSALGVRKDSPAIMKVRSTGRGMMLQEMRRETLKAKEWEARRRENIRREEEEQKNRNHQPNSASRFLIDSNRVDMSKSARRNEYSWGGHNFDQVVDCVRRGKGHLAHGRNKGNVAISMTGKERREYQQWREERKVIDQERKIRQKKEGNWSRAWDQEKVWDKTRKMWLFEDDRKDNFQITQRRHEKTDSEDWDRVERTERIKGHKGLGSHGERYVHSHFLQHDDRQSEPTSEEWDGSSEFVSNTEKESTVFRQGDTEVNQGESWEECNVDKQQNSLGKLASEAVRGHTFKFQSDSRRLREQSQHGHEVGNERDTGVLPSSSCSDVSQKLPMQLEAMSSENWEEDKPVTISTTTENIIDLEPQRRQPLHERPCNATDSHQDRQGFHRCASVEEPGDKSLNEGHIMDQKFHRGADDDNNSDNHSMVNCLSEQETDESSFTARINEGESSEKEHDFPENPVENERETSSCKGSTGIPEEKETKVDTSRSEKATLPKLTTKHVMESTSADSKKDDPATEERERNENLEDIPPTPDFLKLDKSVNWGDFEIDEDNIVERW